jgi:endonuclease/exonuclease/phosphatase family metal-dependent hydrolase
MTIRVLSYNIHKGFNLFHNYVLPDIRKALVDVNPDLVFLQEIKGLHKESEDQLQTLGGHDWEHRGYGKNNHQKIDHYGNAILSRWPLHDLQNIDLTNHALERRGLLTAKILHGSSSNPFFALTVHLDLTQSGRLRQLIKIEKFIRQKLGDNQPLILAGDFNDWNGKVAASLSNDLKLYEAFLSFTGAHAPTFPAQMPFLALDRMYFRGFEVRSARVLKGNPWRKLSDHLPILVELELV